LLPMILRLEQEFGLTPSSRAGLQVKPSANEETAEKRYFG
jgi:phage terminase small subunit